MSHGEREHVRENPRAQVLERHAKGPQASVAAGKGGRRRKQESMPCVERLRSKARGPVDQALDRSWHGAVVFGGRNDEGVACLQPPAKILRPFGNSIRHVDIAVVERHVEIAHRRHIDGRAVLFGGPSREGGELPVQRLGAERRREDEDVEFGASDGIRHEFPRCGVRRPGRRPGAASLAGSLQNEARSRGPRLRS